MRKLQPIDDDAYAFIKEVIQNKHRKKDEKDTEESYTIKARRLAILEKYKDYFELYDSEFNQDNFKGLTDSYPELEAQEKDDYKDLYSFKSRYLSNLKKNVLKIDGYENNLCPLCGVNLVNSFDHFVPQTKYPLFIVHPRNLIPSCTSCNGHKSDAVLLDGKRKYWNCYIDEPPVEKYLYCSISEDTGMPKATFSIKQGGIDDRTFKLLQSLMDKSSGSQHVLEIYEQASGERILKLIHHIERRVKEYGHHTRLIEIVDKVKQNIQIDYEINNFEHELNLTLLDSDIFMKSLIQELDRKNIKFLR